MRPLRSPRCVLVSLALATIGVATVALADVPSGWTVESTIDGGTSALGASIAATDHAVVVGAPFTALSNGASPSGAVLVYTNGAGAWTSARVTPTAPIDGGSFGATVAASGNLVAVGAPGTPPSAYVFGATADGSYAQLHTWADPPSDGNQSFGGSVAVLAGTDGTGWVAVGAPPGSANPAGVVYVSRELDGGAWSDPPATLTNPSAEAFGLAVAFAGNGQLLVGDPGTGAGQVLIYSSLPDGGWVPQGTLPVAFDGDLEAFGNAIATGDGLAVVTAPNSSNDAGIVNGAAFVFASQADGGWTQQAVLAGAATESFGNFVPAVTEGLIAIGSAVQTASSGAGRVDVWAANGGQWVAVPSGVLTGDAYYGQAVGIVGSTLFVGDTSALGAGSIRDVTSSLSVVAAVYEDGGAATGGEDAGEAGAPSQTDAGKSGAASLSGGGGCACAAAARGTEAPLVLLEGAVVLLAWGARRRARRHEPQGQP